MPHRNMRQPTSALLGECSNAIAAYRDLLLLTPDDAQAWNALGLSLLEIGDLAESKKALEEALRLKPKNADILNELDVVHQFEGDLETAACLYLASIQSDPGFARAYGNLVRSRRMNADHIVFVEPIEKIASDDSRDDESWLVARHVSTARHSASSTSYRPTSFTWVSSRRFFHMLVSFIAGDRLSTCHRSRRPVRTSSSWQVRQPLYRTAKARWKKFDRHLIGLKKALSDRSVRLDSAE